MSKQLLVYTDGSCEPNPGNGGWAAIIKTADMEVILTGAIQDTTNNRMEITAVLEVLKTVSVTTSIKFLTDSKYVVKGLRSVRNWASRDWKRKDGKEIANTDIWTKILMYLNYHDVEVEWVSGHSSDIDNKRVDFLANAARLEGVSYQKED